MADIELFSKVVELAREHEDWISVLEAACAEAEESERFGGRFAGRWVLQRVAQERGQPVWKPGLKLLVGYGLLEKSGESTRGGRRAYYKMTNWREVKEALRLLKERHPPASPRPPDP